MISQNRVRIVNQAIDYVYSHLTDTITAEGVADYCCYSRHYFNSLFKYMTGENLYSFIKRQKLEKAASMIMKYRNLSLTEISSIIGYSSSNFAVAFKNHYLISPSQFREGLDSDCMPGENQMRQRIRASQTRELSHPSFSGYEKNISLNKIKSMYLRYERFIGPYSMLYPVWNMFFSTELNRGDVAGFYGITYSDPLITHNNRCIHDLCIEVPNPEGSQCHYISENDYICYHYKGHIKNLYITYNDFMGCWLPRHKPGTLNQICLERYYPCTEKNMIDVDICIPLT